MNAQVVVAAVLEMGRQLLKLWAQLLVQLSTLLHTPHLGCDRTAGKQQQTQLLTTHGNC